MENSLASTNHFHPFSAHYTALKQRESTSIIILPNTESTEDLLPQILINEKQQGRIQGGQRGLLSPLQIFLYKCQLYCIVWHVNLTGNA